MKVICPQCQQPVEAGQINVATDVAFCRHCNEAFSLADQVATRQAAGRAPGEPPEGCWFRSEIGQWEAGATTRSHAAWILVPFACVWSGGSLGFIFGTQLIRGEFDALMTLFGIPFLFGMIPLVPFAVMSLCGKVVLAVDDDQASLFVGAGPIGRRRRFRWSQIVSVSDAILPGTEHENPAKVICLEGTKKPIHFGLVMSNERRAYLLRLLRRMLVNTADSSLGKQGNPAR
jgi:hypothetical protein